jgi:hypothetical protein
MQAVNGYLEDGHEAERRAAWLNRLHKAVDASLDEDLPDFPPRQPMRPPLDFTGINSK